MGKRQKSLSIIIFIAALGVFYFIVWESIGGAYQAFGAWRKEVKEVSGLENLISKSDDFSRQFERISSSAALALSAIPFKLNESELIVTLSRAAVQSGAVLTRVEVKTSDSGGIVPVSISLLGNIGTLERFIGVIGKTLPFFDFSDVTINQTQETGEFAINLQSYVFTPQAAEKISYSELEASIEKALTVNTDVLKDERLKEFQEVDESLVPLPSSDMVGRENPFAEL